MAEDFIPFAIPSIGEEEAQAAAQAVRSGWLTTGPQVIAFEREFVEFLGDESIQAVAVNSATAGLHLALEAAGIGPGDEVIVPTWTFTATAEVVRYLGALPILVDVDPRTLFLDFDRAAEAITERTRAIMPVHFGGMMVNAVALKKFADRNNLVVIEDAAHVLPGTSEGAMVGTGCSTATVFSFYATKTITTGEGGMVVTRDKELADRMRTMRLHGINRDVFDRYRSSKPSWQYEVVAPGFKYNMTDVAASIGRIQLNKAWHFQRQRAEIAERYNSEFQTMDLTIPAQPDTQDVHSWHLYVIRLGETARLDRDQFIEGMATRGIGCSVHFIPLHMQPVWRDICQPRPGQFDVADREFPQAVSLPIFASMSPSQVDRVIDSVKELLA